MGFEQPIKVTGDAGAQVRLAHEALIRSWPRAARLIAEDRDDLSRLRAIEEPAQRWRMRGKAEDLLIPPGLPLEEAALLRRHFGDDLSPDIAAYIDASVAADAKRRRARTLRQRLTTVAAVVFACVAVLAAWQWTIARTQTRIAENTLGDLRISKADRTAGLAEDLITRNEPLLALRMALESAPGPGNETAGLTPRLADTIRRSLRNDQETSYRFLGENTTRLATTADQKTLVTSTRDGRIQIWDMPSLKMHKNVLAQDDVITTLKISPDQRSVLVAGGTKPAIFLLETGERIAEMAAPEDGGFIKSATFSPDGKYVAAGVRSNFALIFDSSTGKLEKSIQGPDFWASYRAAGMRSADDSQFDDPIVAGVAEANFGIFGASLEVAFSPDQKLLAVAGPADPEAAIRLYDVESGKLVSMLAGEQTRSMGGSVQYGETFVFSTDGTRLLASAVGSGLTELQIFDLTGQLAQQKAPIAVLRVPASDVSTIYLSPDGSTILSGHRDGSINIWCAGAIRLAASLKAHSDTLNHIVADGTGAMFLATSSDGRVTVWPMPTAAQVCPAMAALGQELKPAPIAVLDGHWATAHQAIFTPDSKSVLSVSRDGTLRAWSLVQKGERTLVVGPSKFVDIDIALSADGVRLAALAYSGIRVWNIETGADLGAMSGSQIALDRPDGSAAVFQKMFQSTPLGAEVVEPADDPFKSISTFGMVVNSTGTRGLGDSRWAEPALPNSDSISDPLHLYDIETRQKLAVLSVNDFVAPKAGFSPDGSRVVAKAIRYKKTEGESESALFREEEAWKIAVWNAADGKIEATTGEVGDAAHTQCSSDGQAVLAYSGDMYNEGYEFTERKVLFRRDGEDLKPVELAVPVDVDVSLVKIKTAALSSDGMLLAAGHDDGTIALWAANTGTFLRKMGEAANFPLLQIGVSADNSMVAAVNSSNTLTIRDIATNALLYSGSLAKPATKLRWTRRSTGAQSVVVLMEDSNIQIVAANFFARNEDRDLVDWARAAAPRELTPAERRRFGLAPAGRLPRPDLGRMLELRRTASTKSGDELAQALHDIAQQALTGQESVHSVLSRTIEVGALGVWDGAMAIARRLESFGPEARELAFFYFHLALITAPPSEREQFPDRIEKARESVRTIINDLPRERAVEIYRDAVAWRGS